MIDFAHYTKNVYSAVLSDVLDSMGLYGQAMKPFIRPVDEGSVMMGRARTGLYASVYGNRGHDNPYELEIRFVDDLKPGDLAALACNGPTERIAPWGELLSTASTMRGAHGCVTDGLVRDIRQIRELKFPVFHGGIGPLDSIGRAKMIEFDTEIVCGGVTIRTGDIIFGDIDGVVVIPKDIAEEVVDKAAQKAAGENNSRRELLEGRTLQQVYDKYGIL